MNPASRLSLLAAGWLASLALVYWLGRTAGAAPTGSAAPAGKPRLETPESPPVKPEPAPASRAAGLAERKAGDARREEAATPEARPFAVARAEVSTRGAQSVLARNDPIERTAEFIELLRGIDARNAPSILAAFEDGRFGYDRSREFSLFLYAWGQVDGAAASAHLQAKPGSGWDKMRDMQSVLSGWATRDADSALDWARKNWKGEENPYLVGVISGVAKGDLKRASEIALELPYGRVRGQVVELLVDGHLQQGDTVAMNWAEAIPDERLRDGAVRRVAARVGQNEPALAADWLVRHSRPDGRRDAVEGVMESWSRQDPLAASAWADRQSDPQVRLEAVGELAGEWARQDADAAAAWVARQPEGALRDEAIGSYARGIRRSDPAKAMQWAGSIQDTEKRRALLERLMHEWTERDPKGAQEFLDR